MLCLRNCFRHLRNALIHVPLLGPLFSFPWEVIRRSFFEISLIWIFSSLPIIFLLIDSTFFEPSSNEVLSELFGMHVIFVYAAAFLSPMIFLIFDRVIYPKKEGIFPGAVWILPTAVVALVFTSWTYEKAALQDIGYLPGIILYVFSIYCWFLAIADNRNSGQDIPSIFKEQSDKFVAETRNINHDK